MNEDTAQVCKNPICRVNYPHSHMTSSIDSDSVSATWPHRLFWKRPDRRGYGRNPYRLFQFGWFASHSGFQLPWKFALDGDCGWEDLAELIAWKFAFRGVYGIPRGGVRLADALQKFAEPDSEYPMLIVDDVLTTGRSFKEAREKFTEENCIGVVVCARGPCPSWVFPILTVSDWAQSRATGLG